MTKSKNILFRADSSSSIGLGHIMRDLVLASHYKDSNVIFATQDLEGNINQQILDNGYSVSILKSNDKKELVKLIKTLQIDLLVIDHYDIDYKIEKYIKKKTDIKILSLDDTYQKHFCDILLNHNLGANSKRYKKLIEKDCELRCGSQYTLLRDEFIQEKKKKVIFIAMGGSDSHNLNSKILKVFNKVSNIQINIVTTTANKNLKELEQFVKNKQYIKLHINSNKIAKLMRKSDLAIVTPSVILNEIYYMDIPFIAIKIEDNQLELFNYLKKNQFNVLSKFNSKKLIKILVKKGIQ